MVRFSSLASRSFLAGGAFLTKCPNCQTENTEEATRALQQGPIRLGFAEMKLVA